jgi:beta-lactam-binding protein with PASTA domain
VAKGETVQVIVSQGRAPVEIPDVGNKTAGEAIDILQNLGFVVQIRGDATKRVLQTEPEIGSEAPYGSEVIVTMRAR